MFTKFSNLFKSYYTNDAYVVHGINIIGMIRGRIIKTRFPNLHPVGSFVVFDDHVFRKVKALDNNEFEEYNNEFKNK